MKWSIRNLDSDPESGIVSKVHYLCYHEDEDSGISQSVSGDHLLDEPSGTVLPYKDITEEKAIEWLKAKIGESNAAAVENIEDTILSEIEKKKNPTVANGKPWE